MIVLDILIGMGLIVIGSLCFWAGAGYERDRARDEMKEQSKKQ